MLGPSQSSKEIEAFGPVQPLVNIVGDAVDNAVVNDCLIDQISDSGAPRTSVPVLLFSRSGGLHIQDLSSAQLRAAALSGSKKSLSATTGADLPSQVCAFCKSQTMLRKARLYRSVHKRFRGATAYEGPIGFRLPAELVPILTKSSVCQEIMPSTVPT